MRFSSKTSTYTIEKTKRDTIESFSQWMEAWNAFMQTRLHFKPGETFKLFSYQKLITTLCTQFKFKSVYSYDINFRSLMARERTLAPEQRSGDWGRKHWELACCHLTEDNRLPPMKCYNCSGSGHSATNCPEPKQKEKPRSRSTSPRPRTARNRTEGQQPNNNNFRPYPGNCDHFNRGNCRRGTTCRFPHRCNKCDGNHPRTSPSCPINASASTGFRPGP